MLKIGLVDHHLNNYHSDVFLKILHNIIADEECRIVAGYESNPSGEIDWCEKNNVPRFPSAEEVASNCDAVMVMAPDNIQSHRRFCEAVLPFKKPTFIDKHLAPQIADAKAIVELAKKYGTPIMSSSALAFAVELEQALSLIKEPVLEMFSRGFSNWDYYGVHTIAIALRVMGANFKRLIDTGTEQTHFITLDYGNARIATIEVRTGENQQEIFPWQFGIKVGSRYISDIIKDYDGFYINLMKNACKFFKGGEAKYSVESALATVTILENAVDSQKHGGIWIEAEP